MSGLLVKSTVVMRENLEEMTREGIDVPVLLGGAALTRRYVEEDCVTSYGAGRVAYARDAFDGLDLMDKIVGGRFDDHVKISTEKRKARPVEPEARARPGGAAVAAGRFRGDPDAPRRARDRRRRCRRRRSGAPAWSSACRPKTLVPYLNETMLFQFHWGFRKAGKRLDEYKAWTQREVKPILTRMLKQVEEEEILQPQAVYGYWRCYCRRRQRRPARRGRREGGGALRLPAPEPRGRPVHRRLLPRPRRPTSAT